MGIWILIALLVLAFIVADAFFDVSAKFARWWVSRVLPFWGSIWGRARDAVEKAHPAHSTWNGETPARAHYDWLGFLWKAKWAILIVLGFAFAVGALRGCTPIWGPSRDTLKAELRHERDVADAAERARKAEAMLADDVTERRNAADAERRARSEDVANTEQEIHDAEDLETRLAAYRALRERLRVGASEHLARADADYVSSLPER